jgi:hypothetical protein
VVLTKGTKSLAEQTISRVKKDFQDFISADQVGVYDILSLPKFTPYELRRKLVFVVKKEDDNLHRLLALFGQYADLQSKSVLIIDDEADLASITSRKENGVTMAGVISRQIDRLRDLVAKTAFLQVTATPYALYLQPADDPVRPENPFFTPKRPAFTVLLPIHDQYVGGEEYFERSTDSDSAGFYFYREVPIAERDALRKEDRRRLQVDRVLTERNASVLAEAVITFLVGGAIRRLQQRTAGQQQQKYSFLFHTEHSRASHEWQEKVMEAIREALVAEARVDSALFADRVRAAYDGLQKSLELEGMSLPKPNDVLKVVALSLMDGELMITKVNSDNDIKPLLDEDGQLKLRTPFNLFIGGQILDRGITINNLIGFYYGRSPKRFQQDTVLQHSRMYGARSKPDLAVTRFYAPQNVYQVMKRIHQFDGALREAFESGAHDRGVYFLQKDPSNVVIPCSPNKLLFSDVVSIRPGRRLVLSGFQTVPRTRGLSNLKALDDRIDQIVGDDKDPILIDVADAVTLLDLAYDNIEFEDQSDDDRKAHIVALQHLASTCKNAAFKGKVWLLAARERGVRRKRDSGRFSNAPDTKQQREVAGTKADDTPVLTLLRQDGEVDLGWRGLPFWWPVIMTPRSGATVIFATDEAVSSDMAGITVSSGAGAMGGQADSD